MSQRQTPSSLIHDIRDLQKTTVEYTTIVDRLDSNLEKLSEVSSDVAKILAVQEQKLDHMGRLISRQDEVLNLQAKRQQDIQNSLYEIKDEINKNTKDEINKLRSEQDERLDDHDERLDSLERNRYMVMGRGYFTYFCSNLFLAIL